MDKFTDLLDDYLLALGAFNQLHVLHQADPLQYGPEYRASADLLMQAKKALNNFFEPVIQEP